METYYLVDYENVGTDGVSKCGGLEKTDHLHIFYTENAKRIDLDVIGNHGKASLETHKVPVKNQSVDMHIVSYLGYLLGKNEGKAISVVIISKDKDYDNVIKFWKGEKTNISRKAKIELPQTKSVKTAQKKDKKKDTTTPQKKEKKKKLTQSEQKVQLNSEIQKALSKAGYERAAINNVAKLVGEWFGKDNFKQNVYSKLRQQNSEDYDEIYKEIKSILTKYS